jgi:penicillin-binding protein 1A
MKTAKIAAFSVLAALILAIGGIFLAYQLAQSGLPGFTKITDYRPPLVTTVFAKDNRVLGYLYRERRFLARLDQMSPWLPKAFLAAEDSGFYQHEGVDILAIVRAMIVNLRSGQIKQGGSTITQQIIKRLLLTPEKSFQRKLKEAILAYRLENYLTKEEILTIYLNQIFLGARSYGVEAAAREFFGKHASELSLAESAILAGLPQAPSRYNPLSDPEAAKVRQKYVLDQMLHLGWCTKAQHDAALKEKIVYKSMEDPSWKLGAYYLEEVRRWLIERYGEDAVYEGGMTVYTACDLTHQAAAEKALRKGLVDSAKRRGWDGPAGHLGPQEVEAFLAKQGYAHDALKSGVWIKAVVADVTRERAMVRFGAYSGEIPVASMAWCREPDVRRATEDVRPQNDAAKVLKRGDVVFASIESPPAPGRPVWRLALEREPGIEGAIVSLKPDTGEVVALSGGYEFERSQFNRATQAKRQPGSAFKPIVYSAAIDAGFTPATVVLDGPIVFENQAEGKVWRPENYEGIFYGPTLLATALAKSRNLVTVRVAHKIGIRKVIDRAKEMGLETDFPPDLSVALGSASVSLMNLCQAYTAFARGGSQIKPRLVLAVKSAWGEDLFASQPEVAEAMSPQTAYIMCCMLKEVVQSGTGWRARELGRPVAGKTGTTNNEQDAWFMAFTPYLLTGVYVGFDQLQPMGRLETGARAASPIWLDYRKVVEEQFPVMDFPQPQGVVMARVVATSGLSAEGGGHAEYFLPFKVGTQPGEGAGRVGGGGGAPANDEELFKQVF